MKKIRWGILGTAHIAATAYIPAIRASRNGVLFAVASRDAAKAETFARAHGCSRWHASYEALLADPEVDAIYLPLPNGLHATWALKAAAAGKPVLVEKPLAANAAEARAMFAAHAAQGLALQEALMFRLHPLTLRVKALLDAGTIGRLRSVRASFFADIQGNDNIRLQNHLAGGALRDLGCYCVSVLRLMAGDEPDAVRAVADFSGDTEIDLRMAGVLRFPNGVVGDFACGFGVPFSCDYELIGETGRMRVDQGAMVAWPDSAFPIQVWTAQGHEVIVVPEANHYQLMAEAFADAVLSGAPLPFTAEETLRNLTVMDQLRADAERQR